MAILEKLCHISGTFIYTPILILYYTNVIYDDILEFELYRADAKVTVAIFRKILSLL